MLFQEGAIAADVQSLSALIAAHDVIFLLTDTRERSDLLTPAIYVVPLLFSPLQPLVTHCLVSVDEEAGAECRAGIRLLPHHPPW